MRMQNLSQLRFLLLVCIGLFFVLGGPGLVQAQEEQAPAQPQTAEEKVAQLEANVNGYYASWQDITDFGYIDPSKFLRDRIKAGS